MAHTPPRLQDILHRGDHPALRDWLARGRHREDTAITPLWRGPISADLGRDLACVYARLHGFSLSTTIHHVCTGLITVTGLFHAPEAFATALLLHAKEEPSLSLQDGRELLDHLHHATLYRRSQTPRYTFFGHLADCIAKTLPEQNALERMDGRLDAGIGSASLPYIGAHLSIYGSNSLFPLSARLRRRAHRPSYLHRSGEQHLWGLLTTGSTHRLLAFHKLLAPCLDTWRPYAPYIVTDQIVRVALAVQ